MKYVVLTFGVLLALLGTGSRIISVRGVALNSIVVVSMLGIILAQEKKYSVVERWMYAGGGVVLPIIFFSFWMKEVSLAVGVAVCAGLAFKVLTGNEHVNLFMCGVGGTYLFYGLLTSLGEPFPSMGSMVGESIGNTAILILAYQIIKRYVEPEMVFRA